MTHEQRAALYDGLICVTFEERHCRPGRPNERGMVGRCSTVVVNRPYKAGDCLGVYGGPIAEVSKEVAPYMPLSCMLEVPLGRSADDSMTSTRLAQRGDNILAQLLTLFDEDRGQPCAQAKDGYNVDSAQFKVKTEDGRYLFTLALFTLALFASGRPGSRCRSTSPCTLAPAVSRP
jgi:hypothetical protein